MAKPMADQPRNYVQTTTEIHFSQNIELPKSIPKLDSVPIFRVVMFVNAVYAVFSYTQASKGVNCSFSNIDKKFYQYLYAIIYKKYSTFRWYCGKIDKIFL